MICKQLAMAVILVFKMIWPSAAGGTKQVIQSSMQLCDRKKYFSNIAV